MKLFIIMNVTCNLFGVLFPENNMKLDFLAFNHSLFFLF